LSDWAYSKPKPVSPLVGTAALIKDEYWPDAIPFYVLIDRKGIIRYADEGYPPVMEDAIQRLLNE